MLHKLLILTVLLAPLPAQADIYKWRDEAGKVHYGAVPPPGVELEVIEGPRRPSSTPVSPPPATSVDTN
ncbi:MAG: DUF4124 domain-containing protein, partial [Candidatus Competibacteraceae bacterium]|nr:DUF4124 domain-containing protein [Candidatus Competibacteraceae bacterium]